VSDITYSDAPKPLTQKERDLVNRIFSDWFEVPGEWKGALRSYLESDPPVLGKAALGPAALLGAFTRGVDGHLSLPESFTIASDSGDETRVPLYVNINGTVLQVRVGQAGSGPGGQGRMLWVD
jgi:hypothetical protein